ncbi:TetR/AcrR family transcriptional regulator [Amycolatopsis sp. NBC_01480]|uniref:TetR/AcrR family transcriptional regulator n=1 Tax=Amycolatopsis sp. NBC_01480 TaxID=2903562 RepID=UPI002E2A98E2|nr:TetR/AcrR family transcriptional regulator [Amycolatopsis sp. NBC_01480]
MISRAESAAATRRALIDAAAELLDLGGLGAVTLRAVGARAGVTRGAPYTHFPDKESLLIEIGTRAWERLADQSAALRANTGISSADKLGGVVTAFLELGRRQPHLYRLMFSNPAGDPTAMARAAQRSQDEFLMIVADLVGEQNARRYGALLIGSVNGITGMEVSNQLADPKWGVKAEELVDTLVEMVSNVSQRETKE